MKSSKSIIMPNGWFSSIGRVLWLLSLCIVLMNSAFANAPGKEDRTLSPYFFVQSENAALDQLPLKSTSTKVNIAGVIADVTVTQTYANTGNSPLEAIYVFPASTRAAVHAMKMTIGKRIVVANIEKRAEARRQYEAAKQAGKSASLLEQQRPNVFQMNLANIMPGDEIQVEMRYTELIIPENGVYEFVYPTVVGPRYSNLKAADAKPSEEWVANPTLHAGEKPTSSFDIQVDIVGGLPVQDVACNTHKTKIDFDGANTALVRLDGSEKQGGNRDFIVRYRLAGEQIQTGLLLTEGEDENFFLLMMQPPKQVKPESVPGREYVFIVDISGSMHGFPLDISKTLLRDLISQLRPSDRFNVMLFSGSNAVMAEESLPATPENIQKAITLIERQQGGGSTELLPAMQRALTLKATPGYSRSMIIVTDGYVQVEEEVFDLIRNNLDQSNLFAFGIGSSVNRHIIEGMARVGMGEPFVITRTTDASAEAERFRKMVQSPVLTNIKISFDDFDAYDVEPLKVPDILAERPLIVFGKWRGKPEGRVAVHGISGDGEFNENFYVSRYTPTEQASALRQLWARHRITLLSDYNRLSQNDQRKNDQRIEEVTQLGLKYSLLTAYTSFIAVDSLVRNTTGESESVKQPSPMPQGVSDRAVGGASANNNVTIYGINDASFGYARATPSVQASAAPRMAPSVRASAAPVSHKFTLSADLLFDFNKSELTDAMKKTLDELITKISGVSLEVIVVVGHADRLEGTKSVDATKLAEQRIQAVKAYLSSKGIPKNRIYIEGKGAKIPITRPKSCEEKKSKKTIQCLAPDRRVEIQVIGTK